MKDKILNIIIGCDTDPDRPGFLHDVTEPGKSWRGVEQGIPSLKELLSGVKDIVDETPKITWLLRVDEQTKSIYGDYGWVLTNFRTLWEQLESDGDELGWHPHFYKFDSNRGRWYQEALDEVWQIGMLENAYEAYSMALPGRAKSVRMGWDYHNNATMRKLCELGVKVDFSALPGLKTRPPNEPTDSLNIYDWYISPRRPYFPSEADYRREPCDPEKALGILELPITTSSSLSWGVLGGLQMARKMRNAALFFQAFQRPSYVVNLTGKPSYFAPLIAEIRRMFKGPYGDEYYFATYFHADELVENRSDIYRLRNILLNLLSIKRLCEQVGVGLKFIQASESTRIYSPQRN